MFDCTVVVISGGTPRPDLTIQTLKSINDQSLKPNEKIFVNHGHPAQIMNIFYDSKELESDWKIISFPINTYDADDIGSLYKYMGPAALDASNSKYIFYIADDDLINFDFLERMQKLINFDLSVTMATGLAVGLNDNNEIIHPPLGSWRSREKIQNGLDVFRNIFKPDELFQPNPGHSYIIERQLLDEVRHTVFTHGFPDLNPLFQILPKCKFAFDRDAYMIRKLHPNQIHNDWDKTNITKSIYIQQFKKMAEINLRVMQNIAGVQKTDINLGKNYFNRQTSRACWISIKNSTPDLELRNTNIKIKLRLKLIYFFYLMKTPIYSFRLIFQPGRFFKLLHWVNKNV